MKYFGRFLIYAVFSLALVLGVFTIGFHTGINNAKFNYSAAVSAGSQADMSLFWDVWSLLEEKYVSGTTTQLTDEEKVWGAISGLVESYGDPYTTFLIPQEKEDFEASISGNFEGVGMEVGIEDGVITVIAPLKDTPAEKAGIKPKDIIAAIDGESTKDMTLDVAVSKMRGKKGTPVSLTIAREGQGQLIDITIVRDVIEVPTIKTDQKDGVFIISIYSFSANAPDQFRKALRDFVISGSRKLVIDLRSNPGGYLDAAVDISSWFLPAGMSIVKEDFGNGDTKNLTSKGYNIFEKQPIDIVVLVDEGSASASEIIAGALQDNNKATVIGTRTFGKGSVQEFIELNDGTALKVTIAQWFTPNGTSITETGITPDIEVEFDSELYENEGRDIQLEKSIDYLLGRLKTE